MKKILYKEIAEYLGKSEQTIRGWKVKSPELLEIVKAGSFCKKNDITIEDIKACVQMQKLVRGKGDECEK
jgi:predicted transcriptional regulator